MRPKIIVVILLAGLSVGVGIFLVKRPVASVPVVASPVAPVAQTEVSPTAPVSAHDIVATRPPTSAPAEPIPVPVMVPSATNLASVMTPAEIAAAQHEAAVQEKINKLQELQANDDPQSLKSILDELTDPEKSVRAAAIESAIQFGNRDAIPVLKAAASNTTDSDEKKALLDAADFLALPTMLEVQAQKPPQ